MRNCIIILLLLSTVSAYSQQGWYQVNTVAASNDALITFKNSHTGIIVKGTSAYVTTNGGVSFTNYFNIPYQNHFVLSTFIVSNNFYISGYAYGFPHNHGFSFKSSNFGSNWIYNDGFDGVNDCEITGDTASLAIGYPYQLSHFGTFLRYSISGSNTYFFTTWPGQNNKELSFINKNTGWLYTYYHNDASNRNRKIFKTTNGGVNFNLVFTDTTGFHDFKDMKYFNENYAIIIDTNKLKFSENGGVSWTRFANPVAGNVNNAYFINVNTGWITSPSIHKTTNAGLDWELQYSASTFTSEIQMLDSLNGYAVLSSGALLKTTTGGVTSIISNNTEVTTFHLYQNYPNPFNPSTKITFDIPSKEYVSLKVYDISGIEITQLVSEQMNAGSYTYEWNAEAYPSGVYFYTIEAGEYRSVNKAVLLK